MFMQMPPEVARLAADLPPPSPVPAWQPPRRAEAPVVPSRRNPGHDVRMIPAVTPEMLRARADAEAKGHPRAWWEDPVALGTLLILAPPIGLACVWRSKHYSTDARWALSVMSALVTCFTFAIVLALVLVR